MQVWLLIYRTNALGPWQLLASYPDHAALIADGPTRLAGRLSGEAAAAQITDAYAISASVTFTAIALV